MALRRHLLPRFWLGITLGGVAMLCGVAYWWERQLPERLEQAIRDGDTLACLHYSEQLAALRWLGQQAPEELALCRRQAAVQAWNDGRHADALGFQELLVNSGVGTSVDQQRDQNQLNRWREQLRDQALNAFRDGNLNEALSLLKPVERSRREHAATGRKRQRLDHIRMSREILECALIVVYNFNKTVVGANGDEIARGRERESSGDLVHVHKLLYHLFARESDEISNCSQHASAGARVRCHACDT